MSYIDDNASDMNESLAQDADERKKPMTNDYRKKLDAAAKQAANKAYEETVNSQMSKEWTAFKVERSFISGAQFVLDNPPEGFVKRSEIEALVMALEDINRVELNSQRPGGSYSQSARISYAALALFKKGHGNE